MPVTITQQPTVNQLLSAYQPVVIACTATTADGGVPVLVLCDVYINGVYYRTFFSSKADREGKYVFDIQDAIQEKLNYFIPPIDGKKIEITSETLGDVFVRLRTTKLNSSGLNEPEQIAPIPGTEETPPIPGEGLQSNKFFALNLLIQNEENQDIEALLKAYRTNTWNNEALPLTRRNKTNFLTDSQSSFFPFLSEKRPKTICVDVRFKGQANFTHYCKELTNDDINEVSNPPTINIKWMNATTSVEDIADKVWDLKTGAFPLIKIKLYPADPDSDIDTVELFKKTGTGDFISVGLITDPTCDVSALVVGKYEFKSVITDSKSNTAESNILKYEVKDTTPGPGVITLEEYDVIDIPGGTWLYGGHGDLTALDLIMNFGTAVSDFYTAKGMDPSQLNIKFTDALDLYRAWRYNNYLVTSTNYESVMVTPAQLSSFRADMQDAEDPEIYGYIIVMHSFEIYHNLNPDEKFTNYLYMRFTS